jgi:hypothetical protein
MSITRVCVDFFEERLLVLVARHPFAARHHIAAFELLHLAGS